MSEKSSNVLPLVTETVTEAAPAASRRTSFIPPGVVDYEQPLIRSLSLVSGLLGHPVSAMALRAGMPQGKERPTLAAILRAATQAGLQAKTVHRPQLRAISPLTLPCILLLKNDNACVLTRLSDKAAEVILPGTPFCNGYCRWGCCRGQEECGFVRSGGERKGSMR